MTILLALLIVFVSLFVIAFFIAWFIDCSVEERWQTPMKFLRKSTAWMWRRTR